MSDEKPKPFATVAEYQFHVPEALGTHAISIDTPDGDRFLWPGTEPYASGSVERLNAAVEQREAKLRVTLRRLREAATEYVEATGLEGNDRPWERRDFDSYGDMARANRERVKGNALVEALADAEGDLGDYVPAEQLHAEQAKVKALQAAIDAIDTTDREPFTTEPEKSKVVAVAMQYLEANGLKRPRGLTEVATHDLKAELSRRKQLGEVEHVFREHEYGHRDNRVTITGTAYCGMRLDYKGDWNAVTPETFRAQGARELTCSDCRSRFRAAEAMIAATPIA